MRIYVPLDSAAKALGAEAVAEAVVVEAAARGIPVTLKALDSPYREITRPVVDYVKSIRSGNPRDLVVVYVPEYVVGRWWEHLLHNQSALRLKSRLLFTPGVMVTSVPWQLKSSELVAERERERVAQHLDRVEAEPDRKHRRDPLAAACACATSATPSARRLATRWRCASRSRWPRRPAAPPAKPPPSPR